MRHCSYFVVEGMLDFEALTKLGCKLGYESDSSRSHLHRYY
jgi:hypothetical protein